MTSVDPHLLDATALLGCRRGATAVEVRKAYRRALLHGRPDLGHVGAEWVSAMMGARDRLLAVAPPDRRGPARPSSALTGRAMRRSNWLPVQPERRTVDLRL